MSQQRPVSDDASARRVITRNSRLGLALFFLYLLLYAGFIFLNTFQRDLLAQPVIAGVNLAIVYGFGLIIAAFVLAMIYMVLCHPDPQDAGNSSAADSSLEAKR